MQRIERRFMKGVVEYGLIADGDKILVGLSGGKDSLALVELLGRRMRIFKPKFSVVAVHVVMRNIPYQSDVAYLQSFAEACGVPFVLYETEFDARQIPVSRLVFSVRGIGGRHSLRWLKSRDVTK